MKQPGNFRSDRDCCSRFFQSLSTAHRCACLMTVTLLVATTMLGCNKMINRGQSPDEAPALKFTEEPSKGAKYVSDTCGMWGMNYAKIEGIGLAVGLDATGSVARPGNFRDHLYRELKTREDIEDPKELMASKNTEIVILKGSIPPGMKKGELFDIAIECVANTDATSLEGATVYKTRMRQLAAFGNRIKEGLVVGLGRGSVLVDSVYETRQDQANNLSGWILGGGVALEDRPIGLTVRTDTYGAKTTVNISRAINARFTTMEKSGREGIATPKTDRLVNLTLPDAYKNNTRRFSQVIRNIKYNETADQRVNRLDELNREMNDPGTAAEAALRLEAIGKAAIPTLKRALNNPDREIRFFAAEALAYCGQTEGMEILREIAEKEPVFRWYALAALSASRSPEAAEALAEMTLSQSAETRYGAFHALRLRGENDPLVQGDWLTDFYLHTLPGKGEPMLHFSRAKRPEIVLFGEQSVNDSFLHVQSGVTIKAEGDGTVSITEYLTDGPEKTFCSMSIQDLIETLSQRGFQYGEILQIFRKAKKSNALETRLVVDALPRANRAYEPTDDDEGESAEFAADGPAEMFSGEAGSETELRRVDTDLVTGNDPIEDEKEESIWSKIRPRFDIGDYIAE